MGKSLSSSSYALVALVPCSACEPVSSTVVVVTPVEDASDERDAREASDDEAPLARDAAVDAAAYYPELDDPEGCVTLPDKTLVDLVDQDAAVAAQRLVIGRTSVGVGCSATDAGPPVGYPSIFVRRDGVPLLEKGVRYSYRWPATLTMARVNLSGGDMPCANEKVVFKEHGLQWIRPPFEPAVCYEFTSPIDARYMRTAPLDYYALEQLGIGGQLELKLCRAPCPPNTAFAFPDAGTP